MLPSSPASRVPAFEQMRRPLTLAALACAALVCGCSAKDGATPEAASQVAAKVDGTEISVHQINYVLTRSKLSADNPEAAKALRKQILDKLIDQQLLVEKAVEDKLDRSPDVQMGIEAARKDVLADAYLQQINGAATKPDDSEVRAYYTDHPELFSKRRIYQLLEISYPVNTPPDVQAAIKAGVDSGKSADETLKVLSARGVEVAKTDTQRSSEQISLELLPRVYRLNPGQGLVASGPQTVTVLYVKSYEEAPLAQAAALPRIAQFLTNQNLSQNVGALVKNLRSKAKVDYVGEFASADAASPK